MAKHNLKAIEIFGDRHADMHNDSPNIFVDHKLASIYNYIEMKYIRRNVLRKIPKFRRTNLHILDVGAGKGRMTRQFVKIAKYCVALEPFPAFFKVLESSCIASNLKIYQCTYQEYVEHANLKFDLIYISGVLTYLDDSEIVGFMGDVRKMLYPWGICFIKDFGIEDRHGGVGPYFSLNHLMLEVIRPPKGIKVLAQETGFEVTKWRRAYPPLIAHFTRFVLRFVSSDPFFPIYEIITRINLPHKRDTFFLYLLQRNAFVPVSES